MPSADTIPASPSPPPQPPIPSTPGPRVSAFLKLYDNALTSTLSAISYPSFASCFPSIAASNPDALRAMHANMTDKLGTFARAEFETICRERKVVEGLNALEGLIAEGKRRRERGKGNEAGVPPHLLPAADVIKAHLTPVHASQQSQLNAKLQTTQSQNAILAEKLGQQRKEIEELIGLLQGVVKDLESAGERLGEVVDGEGLDGEAREAEEIMLGVEQT